MQSIKIIPIPSLQDNYIWAIIDTFQHTVCIVDPGTIEPVEVFLAKEQLKLNAIFLTHHHGDHTHGANALKNKYQVPIFGPANSPFQGITNPLNENDKIPSTICPLALITLTIPGHTLDHIAYYAPGFLFCGDTLFSAGCGRLFEGTAAQMYASLQKMASLPDDTNMYCGHEYTLNNLRFALTVEPKNIASLARLNRVKVLRQIDLPTLPSTVLEEKNTNPFLRCDSEELSAAVEQFAGQKLSTLGVFTWLRRWKDGFK